MILITDSISQSSNFCWIVLDETTYYISAFAVDSNGTIIDVQTNSITTEFIFAGYQRVEYIQSTGTQYIDTGHKHTANSKVELKFSCQSMSTQWNCIFGSRENNLSSNAFGFGAQYSSYIWASVGGYDSVAIANISVDTIYEISMSKNDFTINGTSTALTTNLASYGYSDLLFNMNENGDLNRFNRVKAKMYYCKIYESNTLVRDFVPCYRKSDNVIGLLDIVNKQFYTNSGSGSFTKGPNVN